jgi:hypothetical protein
MRATPEQSAAAWFEKAVRCYVDAHQGCPWCGGRHCVFRSQRPDREQYACSECDFFACHTLSDNGYFVAAGRTGTAGHPSVPAAS